MTPERLADHWWWRPGWQPGRRMYTWHVTFDDQPAVRDLAALCQARLASLPGLDMVPARWLHLTTQGIGFTDDVSDADLAAIVGAARRQLTAAAPIRVTVGPPRLTPEAILLDVSPVGGLAAIRMALRSAISEVLSPARVMESAQWTPHVSIAYSNTTAPVTSYVHALAECSGSTESLIQSVQLIVLGRDRHMYEWTTSAEIRLSQSSTQE